MKRPAKNVLVYADGRIEEIRDDLVGLYFIKPEDVNGDLWQRKFRVHMARTIDPRNPEKLAARTMVGIEEDFVLTETAAEAAKRRAEHDARVMRECLWGIANYPGDGK